MEYLRFRLFPLCLLEELLCAELEDGGQLFFIEWI